MAKGGGGCRSMGPPGGKGGAHSCLLSGLATRSDHLLATSAEEQEVHEGLGGCGSVPSGRDLSFRCQRNCHEPDWLLSACGVCSGLGLPAAVGLPPSAPPPRGSSQQLLEASDPFSALPQLGPCV